MLTFDELPELPELEYTQHVLFFFKWIVEATLGEEPPAPPQALNQLPQPAVKPWYENRKRPDTASTIYRENHVEDKIWFQMSYDKKREWVANMTRIHGKSVVS